MIQDKINTNKISVGVVGLGLMGSSIVTSLLLSGHPVIAIAPVEGEKEAASARIKKQLVLCEKEGLLSKPLKNYLVSLVISDDYNELNDCRLVLECVIENLEIKKHVYKKITNVLAEDAVIATNTSALPISELQRYVSHPQRFIGVHWAEPAFQTRFMEIIQGDETSSDMAEWVYKLAHYWKKEPTLLKKDIRGFITNRLMYATVREALSEVEKGHISLEDIDKIFKYDFGSWITLMGIFRRMDYLGIQDFLTAFKNIFPKLDNSEEVPLIMQRIVEERAKDKTKDHEGLYHYSTEEYNKWQDAFALFNNDIARLAKQYPDRKTNPVEEKDKTTLTN